MLRRATEADARAIATLFRRSFGTLKFLPTLHTPEGDRRFFSRVLREDEVWLWEEDGRVAAFAALGPERLDHLYVEPALHGSGIGGKLLAHAKERRPGGFDLWTFQRNEGARRFYERRGFVAVELTDGAGNEEREPDIRYAWRP